MFVWIFEGIFDMEIGFGGDILQTNDELVNFWEFETPFNHDL